MKLTEFNKRVKALGLKSRGLRAARAVLVDGNSRNQQAQVTGVDLGQLSKLCSKIESVELCPHCGQPMRDAA
jgi:hypothetical protein